MVILHPMDDDLLDPNGLWSFYIQWMMISRSYGHFTSNGWWSFTSNKGDHEECSYQEDEEENQNSVRRMLLLFMSAKFGRDEKRGATEAIQVTISRNAKKKEALRKDLMGPSH